ncbi:hypothetical protein TorRG33x02_165150 [Trema orientale]|uniref:Transmembrane protein n=1 Tax=Trema orientale TaxID=63057 RepID=A0A2P5EQ33_TREOI|nr:hypothetical protein TorRG33x02_165150 [Trema orientale]
MAKRLATRAELLDRWRGIEEEEEEDDVDDRIDPSKHRSLHQSKEQCFCFVLFFFFFPFVFLVCIMILIVIIVVFTLTRPCLSFLMLLNFSK